MDQEYDDVIRTVNKAKMIYPPLLVNNLFTMKKINKLKKKKNLKNPFPSKSSSQRHCHPFCHPLSSSPSYPSSPSCYVCPSTIVHHPSINHPPPAPPPPLPSSSSIKQQQQQCQQNNANNDCPCPRPCPYPPPHPPHLLQQQSTTTNQSEKIRKMFLESLENFLQNQYSKSEIKILTVNSCHDYKKWPNTTTTTAAAADYHYSTEKKKYKIQKYRFAVQVTVAPTIVEQQQIHSVQHELFTGINISNTFHLSLTICHPVWQMIFYSTESNTNPLVFNEITPTFTPKLTFFSHQYRNYYQLKMPENEIQLQLLAHFCTIFYLCVNEISVINIHNNNHNKRRKNHNHNHQSESATLCTSNCQSFCLEQVFPFTSSLATVVCCQLSIVDWHNFALITWILQWSAHSLFVLQITSLSNVIMQNQDLLVIFPHCRIYFLSNNQAKQEVPPLSSSPTPPPLRTNVMFDEGENGEGEGERGEGDEGAGEEEGEGKGEEVGVGSEKVLLQVSDSSEYSVTSDSFLMTKQFPILKGEFLSAVEIHNTYQRYVLTKLREETSLENVRR